MSITFATGPEGIVLQSSPGFSYTDHPKRAEQAALVLSYLQYDDYWNQ
jgi:hypothetical protein